jgi:hypothetical protein
MYSKWFKRGLFAVFGLILIFAFQNCSPANFDVGISRNSLSKTLGSSDSGNGGAYEGKITIYNAYDSVRPCAEIGANSKPLPNHQIQETQVSLKLVRENCVDLPTPKDLDASQVSGLGTSQITYSGISYSELTVLNDFDVVAGSCPAGKTLNSNAVRNNLIIAGLNLFDGVWDQSQNVDVSSAGSLGSLPRFNITRNTNSYWYERPQQPVNVVSGVDYSFTFLVMKQNIQEVLISGYYNSSTMLNAYFNLDTGIGRDVGSSGINNVSFASRPFSGGYIVTVFFTSPLSAPITIGVAPGPLLGPNLIFDNPQGQAGDSVAATAFQLEQVSNYCQ